MVPCAFGPETGIASSACPDAGVTSIFPEMNQPVVIGCPSRCDSAGLDLAVTIANFAASELVIRTNATIAPHNASPIHTARTNFQWTRSQPGREFFVATISISLSFGMRLYSRRSNIAHLTVVNRRLH